MTSSVDSPRERRRARTFDALHGAAVDLVSAKGLREATTDEIAAVAGVSPRTLFNYFASKEDAVLGLREPVLTEAMLEWDAQRQDLYVFERIAHLMLDIVEGSADGAYSERGQELVATYPELRVRLRAHQLGCEQVLREFLLTVDWADFAARGRRGEFRFMGEGEEPRPESADRSLASVCITSAMLRYIDVARGVPQGEQRDVLVRETVEVFRMLLRVDATVQG